MLDCPLAADADGGGPAGAEADESALIVVKQAEQRNVLEYYSGVC